MPSNLCREVLLPHVAELFRTWFMAAYFENTEGEYKTNFFQQHSLLMLHYATHTFAKQIYSGFKRFKDVFFILLDLKQAHDFDETTCLPQLVSALVRHEPRRIKFFVMYFRFLSKHYTLHDPETITLSLY